MKFVAQIDSIKFVGNKDECTYNYVKGALDFEKQFNGRETYAVFEYVIGNSHTEIQELISKQIGHNLKCRNLLIEHFWFRYTYEEIKDNQFFLPYKNGLSSDSLKVLETK